MPTTDEMMSEEDEFMQEAMARHDALGAEEEMDRLRKAEEAARIERVSRIAEGVRGMIVEAVAAKENSGVERRWREDLTYYYGSADIVRSIRGVIDAALADKGQGRGSTDTERATRSTISVNITRPKVNAAFARLSDMLLPVDDRNFSIEPTPKPEMMADPDQDPKALVAAPKETGAVITAEERTEKLRQDIKRRSDGMQRQIDDNLTECDYNSEARKLLFQAACLGTGIVRGPVPMSHTERAWKEQGGKWKMTIKENVQPSSYWVDVWNAYPDPAANGIPKNMRYFCERDEYNARMLRALRGQPGYIDEQIDLCLKEPPTSIKRMKTETQIVDGSYSAADTSMYEVYHVSCELTKGQLEDLGVEGMGGKSADGKLLCCPEDCRQDPVNACVVMCNGRPIKAYLSPLPEGSLGYDIFCYEQVHGQIFGLGVAYLLRSPQRVLSTTWRMVMDNAALCVGGLIVVERDGIEPADGTWQLYGGKVFYKTAKFNNGAGGKVEDAFKVYNMESRLNELKEIIALALKFSEDETSLPSMMEGNQGAAPDTVGGMTLLMNSANTVLKVMAKRFDDCITKPHIGRYYDWHMMHNPDDTIKGDFNVMARGSSHLVVRDLARQSLVGFMQYSMTPTLAIFFKTGGYHGLRKVAEANHITPDDVLVSEEEAPKVWEQFRQAQAQAAQAGKGGAGDQSRLQLDAVKLKATMEDAERERVHDKEMLQMQIDFESLKYANANKLTLETVKAQLAGKIIDQRGKETLQARELAHAAASPNHEGI